MAGQPKKRAMILELERRTREEFGPTSTQTHADYAALWVENGGTLVGLAQSISGALGIHVMYASLGRYLRDLDSEWETRVRDARARGSFALVETASELADQEHDKDDVPSVKLRVDTKLKIATMFNRDQLGEKRGMSVSISLSGQTLDAFRRRSVATARVIPALEAGGQELESVDAEVVDAE